MIDKEKEIAEARAKKALVFRKKSKACIEARKCRAWLPPPQILVSISSSKYTFSLLCFKPR